VAQIGGDVLPLLSLLLHQLLPLLLPPLLHLLLALMLQPRLPLRPLLATGGRSASLARAPLVRQLPLLQPQLPLLLIPRYCGNGGRGIPKFCANISVDI